MEESRFEAGWRRPAPYAGRLARLLFAWRAPAVSFAAAFAAISPFIAAALLAPTLLTLAPTIEVIAPIAAARAAASGAASFADNPAPFHALLLLGADLFADAPGRLHLLAKAFAAFMVSCAFAYFAAVRFPLALTAAASAALAASIVAPFAGPADIALGLFLAAATAFLAAPADEARARALREGVIAGVLLAALWFSSSALSLAAFLALSACPFLTGRAGLRRYAAALAVFAALAALFEAAAPGVNLARAAAASGLFAHGFSVGGGGAIALGGLAASSAIVIFCAAIFGGGEHARGWGAGLALVLLGFLAARVAGANPAPVFVIAAALAALSVASPFYDGVFRAPDRASVSLSLAAASLTLFWAFSLAANGAGQLAMQGRAHAAAPPEIRNALALAQPAGPSISQWIEEGRFSTPEARELLALSPLDQSALLLEAAARARRLSDEGAQVAILAGADAACVIAGKRLCAADGEAAASAASIVLVPRLDLDPASAAAKGRSEAMLYTEFRLAEQSALWDVWVRRGARLPTELALRLSAAGESAPAQ